ncbi:hypothetical protein Taro_029372, partial [Colocasia esculenta]|nr:hypothetical protein [Colocasia esculenta]
TPDCCFCNPFLGAVHGGTRGCSSLTSWHVKGLGWFCLWALSLVEVCAEGCFRIVFDSAGYAGVVFGPTLVSNFASGLLEFLLLWLVRDWLSLLSLVRETHPPTLFR